MEGHHRNIVDTVEAHSQAALQELRHKTDYASTLEERLDGDIKAVRVEAPLWPHICLCSAHSSDSMPCTCNCVMLENRDCSSNMLKPDATAARKKVMHPAHALRATKQQCQCAGAGSL